MPAAYTPLLTQLFVTSANEVQRYIFTPLCVCLSVSLRGIKITSKVMTESFTKLAVNNHDQKSLNLILREFL